MSGHVFHPGHPELHGVTVVVDTVGPKTYIGRFDRVENGGMQLLNVATHDPDAGTREEFVRRSLKFGVRLDLKHLVLPEADVTGLVPLAEIGI
ncbi:MAG: hypothetical protein ACHQXA_03045 [Gemmatimonadales bacterium]